MFFAAEGKLFRADAPSFVTHEVACVPNGDEIHAPLSITDDLQWVGARVQSGAVSRVCRISTTGAGQDCLDSPFLGTEQPLADHVQIHPHRPELLMFAHDCSWVRDRVWRWKAGDAAAAPLFIQPEFVEMGHESWCRDAAATCVVPHGSPTREIPFALNVIDLNGLIVEQYSFVGMYASHASGSPDGRYWVRTPTGRTQTGGSGSMSWTRSRPKFTLSAPFAWAITLPTRIRPGQRTEADSSTSKSIRTVRSRSWK